jgi:diguanylate cyclase (GGDEF)-like protein/PAS domain S-box-containing protein
MTPTGSAFSLDALLEGQTAAGLDPTPVLCVEDEAASLTLLVRILGKRFSRVLVARDGTEGLRVFQEHRPPIVITDIRMPNLSGIDMARAIKGEAPATHLIVTTAHGDAEAILSAVDVGVVDYVLKPVAAARLGAALDKCFRIRALEQALQAASTRMASILESIGDAFFALDREGRFIYLNHKAERHFGKNRAEVLGARLEDLGSEPPEVVRVFNEVIGSQKMRTFQFFAPGGARWCDARVFPLEGGVTVYLSDVTERRKQEEEIQFLAFYDPLTGLANRTLLQERLTQTILWCKRNGTRGAVLFLDLDRFKAINDALGHEAGDRVLQEVANRLRTTLRECDTVARLGGDEFVMLMEGFEHPDNIHSIAHRLLYAVAQEIDCHGTPVSVTGSLGICFVPADGETVDDLLKASDTAMYHGKAKGRNTYQFFRPEMNSDKRQYLQMESALKTSVRNCEFTLRYQPLFELGSQRLHGFEALVRWYNPVLGLTGPDTFIPLAEETGLILLLGDWVLEHACAQGRAWMERHPGPLRMAVNLSARQFWQSDLVETIQRGLASTGLPGDRLELEITESMVMRDVDQAIAKMHALTALGIRLSMDDFGTGYSSLSALRRFPIHTLKIDKSFVKEVTTCPQDAAICASILALARTMNLTVVAEGIETREQLDFLVEQGCALGQGYYFSKPVPALEAETFLG